MHSCNFQNYKCGDHSSPRSLGSETPRKFNIRSRGSGDLDLVVNFLQSFDGDSHAYKYFEHDGCNEIYYVHLRNKVIIKCSKAFVKVKYQQNNEFIKTKRFKNFLIVIDKSGWFKPQAFPGLDELISIIYNKGKDLGVKISSIFNIFRNTAIKFKDTFEIFGRIDWSKLGDLIISIFLSASTALCGIYGVLQFLYNLLKFVSFINSTCKKPDYEIHVGEWEANSLSLEALMAGFSLMGLPSWLVDKIKNFALLTGVKIHASHSFSTMFSKIRDILIDVLSYIFSYPCFSQFSGVAESFLNVIKYLFSPFNYYDDIQLVVEQYTQFVKDSSVLHNPVYRNEVMDLFNKLNSNNDFQDYIKNNDNKHFTSTWVAYRDNLVKFVSTYASSSRDEPVCIVFDGPPASGKSVLMNKFVDLLKSYNMSVYTHTVPPIDSSKDFYDDYMNQDVFVMDDVGQQGKSQWRTIINFVSPVKYPLDCAQADKKNTKFFQSKIILCTTNNFKHLNGFVSKDGISCPEALFRRVHLIEVRKNRGHGFSQTLSYNKFDDTRNQWVPHFVSHNDIDTNYMSRDGFPFVIETPRKDGLTAALKWLFTLYKHIEESNRLDRIAVNGAVDNNSIINNVINNTSDLLDELSTYRPQFFNEILDYYNSAWNGLLNGNNIFSEYVNYASNFVIKTFKNIFTSLYHKIIKPIGNCFLDKLSVLCPELYVVCSTIFNFLSNLFKGDFVEKHEVQLTHDSCYVCFDQFSSFQQQEENEFQDAATTNTPICIHPCGHAMCATCAMLYRRNLDIYQQPTCGMCRSPYTSRDELVCYYVGGNKVSYDVVRNYVKEGYHYVNDVVGSFISRIVLFIDNLSLSSVDVLLSLVCITYITYILLMIKILLGGFDPQSGFSSFMNWLNGKSSSDITYTQFAEAKKRSEAIFNDLNFNNTSAESFKKNHCRILLNPSTGEHTCIVVSGKRFLTNSHVNPDGAIVDIFHSYDHFKEGHKEMESVKVKVIKNYLASDVCVCEFVDVVPFYKMFNRFGGVDTNKFSVNSFISPYGIIPLVPSVNVGKNKDKIVYKYRIKGEIRVVTHEANTGYQYGVQGAGLCGSVIYDCDRVVGVHVTGNGKDGFAQIFPAWLCEELNREMSSKPFANQFEPRDKVIPNFSGTRLTYDDAEKWKNYGSLHIKTSLIPSSLHISNNDETKKLYSTIYELQKSNDISMAELELKQPPIFGNSTIEVKQKMVDIASKSFKHQGEISSDELSYINKCLRAILPDKIHDITDEETSFGGPNVKAFKKDTSNGFSCLIGKDKYLDFENKVLTNEGQHVISRLKFNAENDIFDENDFVCRETFKDELRSESKINEPRLFRVMPFPHIWWSKKIFGELIPWFKSNLHKFGVCVGFNPYKDFHEMVKNLKRGEIFGDEDYKKWDGSVLALIILEIRDVFLSVYQGANSKVLNYLMVTIARSWTLIADELYATTHSIPSGTWMTLLINCLVNKALVALTLYRSKDNVTVDDFLQVVSYVCGDDKIFSSFKSSNYNLLTVKKVAEELGMIVTNGDKTSITEGSRDLMKLNFLKRNIVFHPQLNKYVGALSINTLFNTVQWYNSDKVGESLTYDELMRDKCNAVLVESYLHSENCYLVFKEYFIKNGINDLFSLEKIKTIVDSDDGYEYVLDLLKKNYLN